jgi:hypothetical protein
VVSDAGQDAKGVFEDLGNAVRKIYIDFGIEIHFDGAIPIFAREPVRETPGSYCAIATIRYQQTDDPLKTDPAVKDGLLIYLKPAIYGKEPVDVYNYAQGFKDFPHETTANQFFTESQFESYRKLGWYIANRLFSPGGASPPPTGAECPPLAQGPLSYLEAYKKELAEGTRRPCCPPGTATEPSAQRSAESAVSAANDPPPGNAPPTPSPG